MDSVPKQVLVWRRADRVPDHTWHGAAVRCVSEAKAVWRSQDLIEQRIRIEQANELVLLQWQSSVERSYHLTQCPVVKAGERSRQRWYLRVKVGAEEADVWRIRKIRHIDDQKHPCTGSEVERLNVGYDRGDRRLNNAGARRSARDDAERIQGIIDIVGADPDHKQVCRLCLLSAKSFKYSCTCVVRSKYGNTVATARARARPTA